MKSLPIGNEDFKDIRDSNCYYVDKTAMIGEILDNAGNEYSSLPDREDSERHSI